MNINDIIKYPIQTEKTMLAQEKNVFTFAVDRRANKIEIKKAIEFIFEVKIGKINIINVRKKPKNVGRFHGFTNSYKKAIVTLKEGSIQILPDEGISKEIAKENKEELKEIKKISAAEQKAAEKIQKAQAKEAKKEAKK